jgi:hypothetical protein
MPKKGQKRAAVDEAPSASPPKKQKADDAASSHDFPLIVPQLPQKPFRLSMRRLLVHL